MPRTLTEQVRTALAQFSSSTRLYAIDIGVDGLVVEAFAANDAVNEIGTRDVIVVSMDAYLDLESLLGHPATLEVSLADGTRTRFSGDVSQVAMLGSDGGLARYRIRIEPWMWRLGQVRNSVCSSLPAARGRREYNDRGREHHGTVPRQDQDPRW